MKIRINFIGTLSKYAGVDSVDLALQDGACYGDLLTEIGNRYGSKFPKQCWDAEKNEFRPPISAIGPNGDIETTETPLPENAEIHFLIPVSGGKEQIGRKTKDERRKKNQEKIFNPTFGLFLLLPFLTRDSKFETRNPVCSLFVSHFSLLFSFRLFFFYTLANCRHFALPFPLSPLPFRLSPVGKQRAPWSGYHEP